jgi:hypothetical protein
MNEVRLANVNDINKIMRFINDNWKENHILSRDRDFFIYEHQDNNTINYVISLEDNKINGILGFIKYSDNKSDIATVIWKALKSVASPMLGIELLEFLRNHKEYNIVFSPGINKETIGIYNYLGIYTGYLFQYIIINNNIENFNILKIKKNNTLKKINFIEDNQYQLIELNKISFDFDFDKNQFIPHKDKNYFVKRYFNHPIYKYKTYGVYVGDLLTSLIVTREVKVGDSSILRIMDYIGDENDIVYVSKYLYQIVIDKDYEYIDFMCYGFNEETLSKAGFRKINLESEEIIAPNYFSPFIQENIKINFMADTKEINKLRICKADGDQDRPN